MSSHLPEDKFTIKPIVATETFEHIEQIFCIIENELEHIHNKCKKFLPSFLTFYSYF